MKIKRLNEDTIDQAMAKEKAERAEAEVAAQNEVVEELADEYGMEIEPWTDGTYKDVEEELDRCLLAALRARDMDKISQRNLLLIGRAGTGKTERIKEWCKRRGITPVAIPAQGLQPTDITGIFGRDEDDPKHSSRLGNTEFYTLDNENTILFLDELNRATPEVQGALLTIIQNHQVYDPEQENKMKILRGMLFTVAAINPDSVDYTVEEMDSAMLTRMGQLEVEPDVDYQLKYFRRLFGEQFEKYKSKGRKRGMKQAAGRMAIAEALLTDPNFSFDDPKQEREAKKMQKPALNPRTLTTALESCNGTKQDFIREFEKVCNPKRLDMIEMILNDYVDVDDKANDALKFGEKSDSLRKDNGNGTPFAKKANTILDQILPGMHH